MRTKEAPVAYINSDASLVGYQRIAGSPYFVDKTGMASAVVPFIGSDGGYICITRPRRFGKRVNAQMLASFLGEEL